MKKKIILFLILFTFPLTLSIKEAISEGNAYVNIGIKSVEMDRQEIQSGERVSFTVILMNSGQTESSPNRFVLLTASSGGRVIADKLVTLDDWDFYRTMKVTLVWDTAGYPMGEYHPIEIEADLFADQYPFDNKISLDQSLIIR